MEDGRDLLVLNQLEIRRENGRGGATRGVRIRTLQQGEEGNLWHREMGNKCHQKDVGWDDKHEQHSFNRKLLLRLLTTSRQFSPV